MKMGGSLCFLPALGFSATVKDRGFFAHDIRYDAAHQLRGSAKLRGSATPAFSHVIAFNIVVQNSNWVYSRKIGVFSICRMFHIEELMRQELTRLRNRRVPHVKRANWVASNRLEKVVTFTENLDFLPQHPLYQIISHIYHCA